jgi:uncharacterized protein
MPAGPYPDPVLDGLTALEIGIACAAVFAGAAVQGTIGFGFALVAVPILTLVDVRFAPGPVVFMNLIVALIYSYVERATLDLKEVQWIIIGRIPGTALGTLAVATLSRQDIAVGIGAVVLVAVALSLSGLHFEPTTPRLLTVGVLSGAMGTAASIGGPPVALVYQRSSGPQLRSTLASVFAVGAAMSVAALLVAGEFVGRDFQWGLGLTPVILLGAALSRRTAALVDRAFLRPAVLLVAALSAIMLLVTELT